MTKDLTFDAILDILNQHHQRATYRAVGDYLGQAQGAVMRGRARTPRHSWIVSHGTLLPRNYEVSEQHPELEAKRFVLLTAAELRKWLANKATQVARAQRTSGAVTPVV